MKKLRKKRLKKKKTKSLLIKMSSFLVKNFGGSRGFYLVHKAVCIGIFNCGDPSVKNI